ncbi:MAG: general secretion pathway protein E [Parcubacteria bacterium C7867-001]|nr:MAG: general secretion pathway protein E [Parcubacteria bacterium C7867-001]
MARIAESVDEQRFKEVLLEGQYLSAEELATVEKAAQEKSVPLAAALVSEGLLTEDLVGQCMAEAFGIKYADQDSMPGSPEVVKKIPESDARKFRAVFVHEDTEMVIAASERPKDADLFALLSSLFPNKKVEVRYTLPKNIDTALKLYEKPLAAQFAELLSKPNASITDIVEKVINHAFDLKVSDIHFEPRDTEVNVRFRIDGVLLEAVRIPRRFYENIVNRVKVLARLPIDEHQRTEDGSFQHPHSGGAINVRVSIAPTVDGEKIVLRLLAPYMAMFTLDTLGFSKRDQALLTAAADKPFGMILVTGPTGSGKTTTLYAFLHELNTAEVNITTIEDPVEYKVSGINQMQANLATDLTFATGLRSIVRQDPDIVLVGEIRDKETAEIAVNAALTGHLLFSTFHANDAATTVPRMIDMGTEPFLLASTLELVIAQRLVRRICETCRTTYIMTAAELMSAMPRVVPYFKGKKQLTLYKGKGCDMCHGTGYRGRVGIFELIRTTTAIQECIAKRPTRSELWAIARSEGSRSLFEDGLEKVTGGVTTLDELLRVAEPDALAS